MTTPRRLPCLCGSLRRESSKCAALPRFNPDDEGDPLPVAVLALRESVRPAVVNCAVLLGGSNS